jgi:hypothetical protein
MIEREACTTRKRIADDVAHGPTGYLLVLVRTLIAMRTVEISIPQTKANGGGETEVSMTQDVLNVKSSILDYKNN